MSDPLPGYNAVVEGSISLEMPADQYEAWVGRLFDCTFGIEWTAGLAPAEHRRGDPLYLDPPRPAGGLRAFLAYVWRCATWRPGPYIHRITVPAARPL